MLAADTTVDVDGEILGKPTDDDDARRMLRLLVGADAPGPHGVSPCAATVGPDTIVVTTAVTFVDDDSTPTIEWYVGTGEPMDKAGGYAIQGAGGALVERDRRQREQRDRPAARRDARTCSSCRASR